MKFISKSFCVVAVVAVLFFGNVYGVAGQQYNGSGGTQYNGSSGCSGYFCFQNPLKVSTICGLIQKLLTALLVLGTPVAVLAMVYAGFMFVLARGNAEKLVKAQKNLLYVLMGIAIFFGSWVLGQVIANTINTIKPGTVNSSNSCN